MPPDRGLTRLNASLRWQRRVVIDLQSLRATPMTFPSPDRDERSSRPTFGRGPAPGRPLKAVLGVIMAVVGSLTLLGLVVIANCTSAFCERAMFNLGLALTGLISAGAQVLVLGGIAMLWSALKTPGSTNAH